MKKLIVTLVVFVVIIVFFIPVGANGTGGYYNTLSGLIWCQDKRSCTHEIAHKLDHEAGWISRQDEFSGILQFYIVSNATSGISIDIIAYVFAFDKPATYISPNSEAYAIIFENSKGNPENMPVEFRKFYNWSRAEELMAKYK